MSDNDKSSGAGGDPTKALEHLNAFLAALPKSTTRPPVSNVGFVGDAGYLVELSAADALRRSSAEIAHRFEIEARATSGGASGTTSRTVVVTGISDMTTLAARWYRVRDAVVRVDLALQDALGESQRQSAIPSTVVLTPPSSSGSISSRQPVLAGLTATAALPGAAAAVGKALLPAIGGIAQVAAALRNDLEFRGRATSLTDSALRAEVAGRLLAVHKWNVVMAGLDHEEGELVALLRSANVRRAEAEGELRRLGSARERFERVAERAAAALESAQQAHDALISDDSVNDEAVRRSEENVASRAKAAVDSEAELRDVRRCLAHVEAAALALEQVESELTTAGEATGVTPLEVLSEIDVLMRHEHAWRLHVGIVNQGGEIHVAKSIFRSARIHYVGGNVCRFAGFDRDGGLVCGGVVSHQARQAHQPTVWTRWSSGGW